MIQPPRVLPSNAPPLRDDGNVYEASKILQEHSGNRQHNDNLFNGGGLKYSTSDLDENVCLNSIPYVQPTTLPFFPPLPLYHQGLRLGYSHGGYRHPGPEDEARIRADAERLYNRLCKTEGYMKYRGKQGKDSKSNDQKWPTHLEKAFCRALVQYPPMGRRKLNPNKKKLQGRNELIADCILEMTGQKRTRKQISSHIQVLKPWVEHDPFIMKWMSKDDMGKDATHGRSSYASGRQMSNYPVQSVPLDIRTTAPSLARSEFMKIRQAKRELDVFRPMDFQMFVQRNFETAEGKEAVERLHTYTNSISNPLGEDVVLGHIEDLHHEYPLLASIHARRPFDCTVLDAEASLAFPVETWKNKDGTPLPGVELGIYFLCVSAHLPATPIAPTARDRGYQVVVHNTFYENGECAKEHSGSGEARIEASDRGAGCVETRIKFGSTFWARTLGRLASRLLDKTQDHSEEVATCLRGINAVQEVVAVSDYGAERLLVIHWKFRHSTGVRGRTSWRRINLPTSQQMDHHPPPLLHSSLTASFEELSTHVDDSQLGQHSHPPGLQSPFEYDNSSSGSALSSVTWSGSFDENSTNFSHHDNTTADTNTFDFSAGAINLSYDDVDVDVDTSIAFNHFDSSTFNFDTPATAPDAGLADYSSQHWYTAYPDIFADGGQAVTGTESFGTHDTGAGGGLDENVQHIFDAYSGNQYEQQGYELMGQEHQASQQAFGGAGHGGQQDVVMKDGDAALAALADASYLHAATGAMRVAGAGEDGVV